MGLVLASLSLLGLGIFGPGIATGLVSGATPARRGRRRSGLDMAVAGTAMPPRQPARVGLAGRRGDGCGNRWHCRTRRRFGGRRQWPVGASSAYSLASMPAESGASGVCGKRCSAGSGEGRPLQRRRRQS